MKLALLFVLGLSVWSPLALAEPGNAPSQAVPDTTAPAGVEPSSTPVSAINADAASSDPNAGEPTEPALEDAPAASEPANLAEEPAVAPIPLFAPPREPLETNVASGNRGPLTLEQELPAAVEFLARMASINIQFDPSLVFTNNIPGPDGRIAASPVVSLRWDNVTAEDALQEVLDNHGLMLVVNPKTGVGRVTRRPTVFPLVTAIFQLKHTSPTNLLDVIKSTFVDSRSKVTADLRTSQLVILTTEREMYAVTNLVVHLDTPTKQVLIEARMIETAMNPTSIKGIDWSGTLQNQNFSFGNGFTEGVTTTRTPGDSTTTTLPSGRTMTGNRGVSTTTELLTSIGAGGISADTARGFHPATAFLNADGVRAVLSFLNTENDTEVVATPRAVTADNQMATLSVTRAFPIFEVTPGSANVASAAQVKYTNLGTILKVTPRITANNNIALKVVPEVSNIDSKDRQIINGSINEANVYAIRRMEADVVIPSGHTLVMGGLISDNSSKSYNKVPILGDLPGIGLLFRRDTKTRNKANLIIFVTPTVISPEDFQPTTTTFLQTPIPYRPDGNGSAWDGGKPYDWKGSVKK